MSTICSVYKCEKMQYAKGFCSYHYKRSRRGSQIDKIPQEKSFITMAGEPMRFINEVALDYEGSDCLMWPFGRSTNGYGVLTTGNGDQVSASRYICESVNGAPPTDKHQANLTCHNGHFGCVNPHHLIWQTREEINHIMQADGRAAKGTDMPQSKLNEQKVRAIRQAANYASTRELAETYGVSSTTIHKVIRRKKWKWVDD